MKQERRIHFKYNSVRWTIQRKDDKQNMAKANKTKTTEQELVKLYEFNGGQNGKKLKKPSKGDKVVAEKNLKLANPVTERANEILAFLKYFPEVMADFEYDQATLWIYITDVDKSTAFRRFLVPKHDFGGLALNVKLVDVVGGTAENVPLPPAYTVTDEEMVREFKTIFDSSGYDPKHQAMVDQYGTVWNFFEFPPIGISYQADDLSNLKGFRTKLVSEVVTDMFNVGSFHISSMTPDL